MKDHPFLKPNRPVIIRDDSGLGLAPAIRHKLNMLEAAGDPRRVVRLNMFGADVEITRDQYVVIARATYSAGSNNLVAVAMNGTGAVGVYLTASGIQYAALPSDLASFAAKMKYYPLHSPVYKVSDGWCAAGGAQSPAAFGHSAYALSATPWPLPEATVPERYPTWPIGAMFMRPTYAAGVTVEAGTFDAASYGYFYGAGEAVPYGSFTHKAGAWTTDWAVDDIGNGIPLLQEDRTYAIIRSTGQTQVDAGPDSSGLITRTLSIASTVTYLSPGTKPTNTTADQSRTTTLTRQDGVMSWTNAGSSLSSEGPTTDMLGNSWELFTTGLSTPAGVSKMTYADLSLWLYHDTSTIAKLCTALGVYDLSSEYLWSFGVDVGKFCGVSGVDVVAVKLWNPYAGLLFNGADAHLILVGGKPVYAGATINSTIACAAGRKYLVVTGKINQFLTGDTTIYIAVYDLALGREKARSVYAYSDTAPAGVIDLENL